MTVFHFKSSQFMYFFLPLYIYFSKNEIIFYLPCFLINASIVVGVSSLTLIDGLQYLSDFYSFFVPQIYISPFFKYGKTFIHFSFLQIYNLLFLFFYLYLPPNFLYYLPRNIDLYAECVSYF